MEDGDNDSTTCDEGDVCETRLIVVKVMVKLRMVLFVTRVVLGMSVVVGDEVENVCMAYGGIF